MKLATTTCDFYGFGMSVTDKIRCLYDAGFKYIDLSMYSMGIEEKELFGDDWKKNTQKIKDFAEGLGIKFVQAHSQGGNPLDRENGFDFLLEATIRSIEICGLLGIENTVMHTGVAPNIGKEEYFEKNLEFLKLLYPHMEEYGVNVLIENSTKVNTGGAYFFFDGADMKEFLDYAGHPMLGACWDTSHGNVEGHQYEDIMTLGKYLKAVHISDNNNQRDDHIMPFMGRMNMDEVMCGLLDSGYNGYFTFEADSILVSADSWICPRREFKRDTRLLNPPKKLREAMEKVLFEAGVYILKSYDCYEE